MPRTATQPDNVLPLEGGKPQASVVMVDPATAERWLGRNTHNRRIRARLVNALAHDMTNGRWQITGEAIKFGKGGVLLDGQHRLQAVVQSGATVPMFVIRNIDEAAQDVMDTGSRRTAGDALQLHSFDNPLLLAATAKWCILFDSERLYTDRAGRHTTHADILNYVDGNDELAEAVTFAASIRSRVDLQPSILATTVYLTGRVDADGCREFFSRLADGIGLSAGSPILALRSRLREVKNKRQRVEPEALMSLVIRAWNAWRKGRRLSSVPLYYRNASIRCPQPE